MHLQYLGYPIANDPIYNNRVAWGKGNAKGGLWADLARADVKPQPPLPLWAKGQENPVSLDAVLEDKLKPLSLDQARSIKEEKRRQKGGSNCQSLGSRGGNSLFMDDVLGGGSEATLNPAAVEAIIHLRKVRDSEDQYARYRDMDRPPLPLNSDPQTSENSSVAGRKPPSVSAKKGLRMMSRQERDILSVQHAQSGSEIHREGPMWYVAKDEKGEHCMACGMPLLPDPTREMLQIWLHAIRYRTSSLSPLSVLKPANHSRRYRRMGLFVSSSGLGSRGLAGTQNDTT